MGLAGRIDAAIDAALSRRIVGCVVLVNEKGRPAYARAAGYADREAATPMALDTIFRLASITKPIVATTVLRLADLGMLRVDDPVTEYLPWFTPRAPDGSTPVLTLRHLLTHTSGITYDVPPEVSPGIAGPIIPLEENLRRLARVPLAFTPGSGWAYGMSIDVLGGVLAAREGASLEAVIQKYTAGPLGMADTHFVVTEPARLAAPYADATPPRRMGALDRVEHVDGVTVFSADRIFNPQAPQSGGGGMAGTTGDVLRLLEVYQPGGTFLQPATRAMAVANQTAGIARRPSDAGKGFSLIGAVTTDRTAAASPCPEGTLDWGGIWGHNWIIDPAGQRTVVVCTNTAVEGCMGAFREEIRDAVFG